MFITFVKTRMIIHLEVICVNDRSKDDSLEIWKEVSEQFPKIENYK